MIAFWLYAGLLFAAALSFILVPQLRLPRRRVDADRTRLNVSLYRERLHELQEQLCVGALDAAQLDIGRAEAARELLDDTQRAKHAVEFPLGRTIPLAAALSTPLLALALYLHWGALDQLKLMRQRSAAQNVEKIAMRQEAASLAATSDSADGWSSLGRAYMAQGRMSDAARAFERAAALAGRPPELLGQWAEAEYFAGGRQWTPTLEAVTDEALARNPREAVSLRLAGIAAFQAGRYSDAVGYWERLAATLPAGDVSRASIAKDIARARDLAK
ncbi:c-type cytochrome biogenesis protein CcmI [Paraburkholderia sp. CNPSo 3157]|uniref:C-type cytochrome biogenesis protein CcmI n=1 Tax=Paraburkholderia franconis TaxID=2654983 RepID=A0A7X1TL86_9BURK|nr:c-type cytochrome biogenesis protein CcmI [Paraburkholderia franconis]MPW23370.1 c-type cytochrome biogenesis protein CcmI [Paraburkholderia franconis]